jgi:uncharacterized delta-60 repeat protein
MNVGKKLKLVVVALLVNLGVMEICHCQSLLENAGEKDFFVLPVDTHLVKTGNFFCLGQSDGKILVFAYNPGKLPEMIRITADRQVDKSFGNNGSLTFQNPLKAFSLHVENAAQQPDGKFIVYGDDLSGNGCMARYTANGILDPSFGTNGWVFQGATPAEIVFKQVTIGADGSIIACSRYHVFKYSADGKKIFGFATKDIAAMREKTRLNAILLQNHKIAIAQDYKNKDQDIRELGITVLNPNGTLDASFANQGTLKINLTSFSGAYTGQAPLLLAMPDSGLMIAADSGLELFKIKSDGTMDTAFDDFGFSENRIYRPEKKLSHNMETYQIFLNGNKILTFGESSRKAMLWQRHLDGTTDTTFGNYGLFELTWLVPIIPTGFMAGESFATAHVPVGAPRNKIKIQKILLPKPSVYTSVPIKKDKINHHLKILPYATGTDALTVSLKRSFKSYFNFKYIWKAKVDISEKVMLEDRLAVVLKNHINVRPLGFQTQLFEADKDPLLKGVTIYELTQLYSKSKKSTSIEKNNFKLYFVPPTDGDYVVFSIIGEKVVVKASLIECRKDTIVEISEAMDFYPLPKTGAYVPCNPFFIVSKQKADLLMNRFIPYFTQHTFKLHDKSFQEPQVHYCQTKNGITIAYHTDSTHLKFVEYDLNYSRYESMVFEKEATHPQFSSFTRDPQGNYYVLASRVNADGDFSSNVRLRKLDATGHQTGVFDLLTGKGSGFDVMRLDLSAKMTFTDGLVAVHFSKIQHKHTDNLNHQSSIFFAVDATTMTLKLSNGLCASHSMGNKMIYDDNSFVYLDLGDCFPRGIQITKANQEKSSSTVIFTYKTKHGDTDRNPAGTFLGKGKWSNDNDCYTKIGGLSASNRGYVVLGQSHKSFDNDSLQDCYNLFMVLVKQSFGGGREIVSPEQVISKGETSKKISFYGFKGERVEQQRTGVVWLTDLKYGTNLNATLPQLSRIGADKFLILYKTTQANYMIINEMGEILVQNTLGCNQLSTQQEIYQFGTQSIWVTENTNQITFNAIDTAKF